MITKLTHVTVLVRDQEKALRWYTEKLGFVKKEDDSSTIRGYRWLTIVPPHQAEPEIVLGKPRTDVGLEAVGRQQPEAYWVLGSDDCKGTYEKLRAKGVEFLGEPKEQPYGVEVGFKDLYGNIYYIIESRDAQPLEKKAVMAEA